METFNILILDTFLLRRKHKLQNCCKRKWVLHLNWPVAKVASSWNRKPWETKLPKNHKSWRSPGSLPSHWGRGGCPWSLLSFHQDLLDVETSLTYTSIPANQQIQKKKSLVITCPNQLKLSLSVGHVTDCCKPGAQANQGTFTQMVLMGISNPGGFQCCMDSPAACCTQANRCCSRTLLWTRGGLSLAKTAVPNDCVHTSIQIHLHEHTGKITQT